MTIQENVTNSSKTAPDGGEPFTGDPDDVFICNPNLKLSDKEKISAMCLLLDRARSLVTVLSTAHEQGDPPEMGANDVAQLSWTLADLLKRIDDIATHGLVMPSSTLRDKTLAPEREDSATL